MLLWVGLGNPGKKYSTTRHNLGIFILTSLCAEYTEKKNKRLKCIEYMQNIYPDVKMIFPQTYMNCSGSSVKKVCNFYDIPINNVVVFHDEIELPSGAFDYKFGGGHRGHNGLRDIIFHMGSPDFHRIRLGVGRPQNTNQNIADFLLERVSLNDLIQEKEIINLLKMKDLLIVP